MLTAIRRVAAATSGLRPGADGHVLGTGELGRDLLSRLFWGRARRTQSAYPRR